MGALGSSVGNSGVGGTSEKWFFMNLAQDLPPGPSSTMYSFIYSQKEAGIILFKYYLFVFPFLGIFLMRQQTGLVPMRRWRGGIGRKALRATGLFLALLSKT